MLNYTIKKLLIPEEIREKFVQYGPNAEILAFIDECRKNPHSKRQLLWSRILSFFFPDYEVHGMLRLYPMHLLSSKQWLELASGFHNKLLDIGAGQGFVTEKARSVFKEIFTTETSSSMAKNLRKLGFVCFEQDFGVESPEQGNTYDVISILNVLDRCDYPLSMLKNATDVLKIDGRLIIATPLPLHHYVRMSGNSRKPREILPQTESTVWEECFSHFYENVIKQNGLEIITWTRLPYLWKNGELLCFAGLDDAVVVCKKVLP